METNVGVGVSGVGAARTEDEGDGVRQAAPRGVLRRVYHDTANRSGGLGSRAVQLSRLFC